MGMQSAGLPFCQLHFVFARAALFAAIATGISSPVRATEPQAAEESKPAASAPDRKSAMEMMARMRMGEARKTDLPPLERWQKLRAAHGFLRYGGHTVMTPEAYAGAGTTRDEYTSMMAVAVDAVLRDLVIVMRDESKSGFGGLGAVDNILMGLGDLEEATGRKRAEIMAGLGITQDELDAKAIFNARICAERIIESARNHTVSGGEAWESLNDLPGLYMARGKLDGRSDAGFRAIRSSLAEYKALKRDAAIDAAKNLWNKAKLPESAGEDALYHLDEAERYLRRAGFNIAGGEGYAILGITVRDVADFKKANSGVTAKPIVTRAMLKEDAAEELKGDLNTLRTDYFNPGLDTISTDDKVTVLTRLNLIMRRMTQDLGFSADDPETYRKLGTTKDEIAAMRNLLECQTYRINQPECKP